MRFAAAFVLSCMMAGCATPSNNMPTTGALEVAQVVKQQRSLFGKRVNVVGEMEDCWRSSCGILEADGAFDDYRRYRISIAPSDDFDLRVRGLDGKLVEISGSLSEDCMPSVDRDVIAVCADRPSTLKEPRLVQRLSRKD